MNTATLISDLPIMLTKRGRRKIQDAALTGQMTPAVSLTFSTTPVYTGSNATETTPNKYSSFAQQQLEKMGWKEGQSLGRDGRAGLVDPITIKKRGREGLGAQEVGSTNDPDSHFPWWELVYSHASQSMGKKRKKDKSTTSSKDDKERIEIGEKLKFVERGKKENKNEDKNSHKSWTGEPVAALLARCRQLESQEPAKSNSLKDTKGKKGKKEKTGKKKWKGKKKSKKK